MGSMPTGRLEQEVAARQPLAAYEGAGDCFYPERKLEIQTVPDDVEKIVEVKTSIVAGSARLRGTSRVLPGGGDHLHHIAGISK